MSTTHADLSKLLSSAALVFVATLVSSGAGLVERVVVGRLLSPGAYGEFTVALSVFTLGATLGTAGFSQGVPRYVARFEDPADARGAWLTGLLVAVGLSTAVAVVLAVSAPVVVPRLFDSPATPVYLLFVASLPAYVAYRIGVGAIRGRENTTYKVLTQNLAYPGTRLALVAGLLWLELGLLATGLGYLGAVLAATALTYLLLHRLLPLRGPTRLHVREMTAFSAPLVVSTVTSTLVTHTDTLMLGYFRASTEVGLYGAAYPIARALTLVLGAVGYMYLPVASRLDGADEDVERVYAVTTKWVYLVVFPPFLTMVAFPETVVSLVFGERYAAAGVALAVLSVGFFTNAAVGRNRETLSALGATRFVLLSNVVALVVNVALNLALIPAYGFRGAAVASASSIVALNLVVYVVLRRRFAITPYTRRSLRAFLAVPAVLVPLALVLAGAFPGTLPVLVGATGGFGALTVVVAAAVGGLEPEDAVVVEFLEARLDRRLALLRRYIPEE
jgi:O-antigen/teichoic acid export membrane protein